MCHFLYLGVFQHNIFAQIIPTAAENANQFYFLQATFKGLNLKTAIEVTAPVLWFTVESLSGLLWVQMLFDIHFAVYYINC